jgi:hypothetical protein
MTRAKQAGAGAIVPPASEVEALQTAAARVRVTIDIEGGNGAQVYIVSRWSLSKQCDSLDDLRALLARMGVAT